MYAQQKSEDMNHQMSQEIMTNEQQLRLRRTKTRIREEHDHLSSNGDPVINITITLGTV